MDRACIGWGNIGGVRHSWSLFTLLPAVCICSQGNSQLHSLYMVIICYDQMYVVLGAYATEVLLEYRV